ncbi:MAG: hypothetical protein L6R39_002462 [Caloplaca ligustica]|nr:MAG: hypothetical protein L6R39_002462 [Caloplaca ligustica]
MLVSNDTAPVYAPLVKVECARFNYSKAIKGPGPDNPVVSFPLAALDNYTGISTPTAWPVYPPLWNFTRPMNATNFTWVDVSSYSHGNGPGASLNALVTMPYIDLLDEGSDLSQQSALIPCLINAKWAAAKIQYDPSSRSPTMHNITDLHPLFAGEGYGKNATVVFRRPRGLSNTISISPEWATLLNVAGITNTSLTGETSNATMIEAILQEFVTSDINHTYSPFLGLDITSSGIAFPPNVFRATDILSATIGAVIAEGLSRQAYKWVVPYAAFPFPSNEMAAEKLKEQKGSVSSNIDVVNVTLAAFTAKLEGSATCIDFTIKRYGYGYG